MVEDYKHNSRSLIPQQHQYVQTRSTLHSKKREAKEERATKETFTMKKNTDFAKMEKEDL